MVRIGRQMAQYDGDSSLQQERGAYYYNEGSLPLGSQCDAALTM